MPLELSISEISKRHISTGQLHYSKSVSFHIENKHLKDAVFLVLPNLKIKTEPTEEHAERFEYTLIIYV